VGRVGHVSQQKRSLRPENPTRALAEFLKPYDPAVRALALGLRKLVVSEVAPCRETLFRTSYTVAFLYRAPSGASESFCHISVHRRHVNLAFMRGSLLPDPNGVLEGDGAWMRHIHVKVPADLDRPELRTLVRAACAEADHIPSGGRVTSIVKRGKAFKGRPR
jgi:hypothetical protein